MLIEPVASVHGAETVTHVFASGLVCSFEVVAGVLVGDHRRVQPELVPSVVDKLNLLYP